MNTAGSWYLSNCGNYFWKLTLCWACGRVHRHHAAMFSSHLEKDKKNKQTICKEPDDGQQRLFSKRWVALWVGAEHSEPISGDQVVHATTVHFRRWVSVRTIRLNSLTFFNLHQAKTFNSPDATTTTLFMMTKIMNLQFPADSLWVSLLPPARRHLGDCNTQKICRWADEKEKFHNQAGNENLDLNLKLQGGR